VFLESKGMNTCPKLLRVQGTLKKMFSSKDYARLAVLVQTSVPTLTWLREKALLS